MTDINPSVMFEDSKGSRYFFYYKDASIYYREIPSTGDTKDTILISQVNGDFAAAIDTDDAIYLTCNSRYKGVLLFIYANSGWKFESIVNQHNSANIYIMDIIVQNDSIHIFFSKKLPVANMYNVYHIHKNVNDKTPYVEYSWKKNSLSEIYAQNIESSYSLLPLKNGIIHYASIWCDGTHYYINYYCYDDSTKSWLHKSLNISYKNQVFIKLIQHNKKINLLCFSNENEADNIHHFLSKSSGSNEIDFKELENTRIDTKGIIPLFYSDDKAMQLAWIKDHVFHQYTFDDSSGKWKKAIDLPITAETNMHILKIMKSSNPLSITKGYYLLDKNGNILRPVEHISKSTDEDKIKDTPIADPQPDMNDYLKQILAEIKDLSDNVRYLNNRMGSIENRSSKEPLPIRPSIPAKNPVKNETEQPALKKSDFKEKFMKNEKSPNYENLLIKQDNITTYVGKSASGKPASDISQGIKTDNGAAGSEKQAFVPPRAEKGNNLFKKIGEFFNR
ncbi:MAG: hypothetical protein VB106_07835 [Clostridiaceae bacterium]|nr:hypothetical protein [Clostridiaceae bacterium]